jgi:formate hydrogenlyase subunit 6/NADH:ubiquinone oxidoreductase subunit I
LVYPTKSQLGGQGCWWPVHFYGYSSFGDSFVFYFCFQEMATHHTSYITALAEASRSLVRGLKLTFRHLLKARSSRTPVAVQDPAYFHHTEGINTIQYPHEMQPIPDNGRYRLHNEIDDCIVCDKCAKICPVNCITIEPVRAVEEIGKTSDGTPKRIYAATFDIDMGKCCFCGLCTTVCPTECLTMTRVFDFSVTDMREHVYAFSDMTATEITSKKRELEEYQRQKAAMKPVTDPAPEKKTENESAPSKPVAKPVFKPKIKPAGPPPTT